MAGGGAAVDSLWYCGGFLRRLRAVHRLQHIISSLAANTKLVQVQYGNLTSSISASGSLVFGNKEDLTFGSAGTVQEVNVGVDDSVKKGDVLAKLDNTSNLSLQDAVLRARIALRDAQDALEKAQTQDIADAQRAVEEAQQQLSNAQTQGPLNIANAEYALDNASQNYNDSLARFMSDSITAQELENARVKLETAKLNLETLPSRTRIRLWPMPRTAWPQLNRRWRTRGRALWTWS